VNHNDGLMEDDGVRSVVGTAYGHWHTDPDGIDRQAVFLVTGYDDTVIWTVHYARRRRGEDVALPQVTNQAGLPQDAGAFLSVFLPHRVSTDTRAWPRKIPRVDLPDVEGVLS